jgi:Ring finger domain
MSSQRESIECCICMDAINFATNNCITPCGHTFCFQCLAKALEKNNTCPCCRAVLMEEEDKEDDDATIWSEFSDDDDEDDDEEVISEDEILTGFRMFHQRLSGEDAEPDDEVVSNGDENVTDIDENDNETLAEVEDITAKLQSRGITMIDLVAMITGRKSTKIAKHTNRFINAFENIIEIAMTDCDREAKEAKEVLQRSQPQNGPLVQIAE